MRYQKRIFLFCLLFSLALFCLPTEHAQGARVAGDNKVTPSAPEAASAVAVPAPDEKTDTENNEIDTTAITDPAPGEMTDAADAKDNVFKKPAAEKVKNSPTKNIAKATGTVKTNKEQHGPVTIDFYNADITEFIKFISEETGKNFIIDSNVKGKVTIISPTKITIEEAYKVFESVLEVNGYTTVQSGSIIKIVPMAEARSKDIDTKIGQESTDPDDRVVTQLIPLKYASPEDIKTVLAPLISKNSIMVSYTPTGMLIVTDVLSNIKRLQEIIEKIDVEGTGEIISVLPLEYAGAESMSKSLTSVFKTTTTKGAKDTSSSIVIVADTRTNSILTLASEVDTLKIKELIKLLDKESPKGEGDIHVYYLQNANAEDLAKVLTSIPTGSKTSTASSTASTAPKDTAVVLSKDVQIIADKATNSIIITASKDDYLVLEDIIRKLDITRKMVYIEALIMEVSMTKEFDLGVQWYGAKNATSLDGSDVYAFGSSNTGTSLIDSDGNISLPTGLSFGVLGDTITIGDLTFPSISAFVRAYGTNSDVHILSTPQVMTLDNEEASITVADNVPYLTSKNTSSTSGNDYSNYDFKDVGVTLTITPQINQERFVRLKIAQTVSQIVTQDTVGLPTTLKREAKTTVVIKDGQTIVIGGLIDETKSNTNYKVPILGDIPILGYLFKSKTASTDKKNLFIFLTPHIIENPAEAKTVYENKMGQIDTVQEGVIAMNNGTSSKTKDERLSDLGYGYLQIKDYDKAAEYYEKALKTNPDNPFALLNMGVIYERKKDYGKAVEMYERLISLNPDARAYTSTNPLQTGRKLTDIAKDNLKNVEESNK